MDVQSLLKELPSDQKAEFSKTVSESDVYLFAGITGDLHPNHIDENYMQNTPYGHRIAHGALIIGYASATSTMVCRTLQKLHPGLVMVSYGYDRIRFIRPVMIGDTIKIEYSVERIIPDEGKIICGVKVSNQHGNLVTVATHILKALEVAQGSDKNPTNN